MYIFDANIFINFLRQWERTLDKVQDFIDKLIESEIKVLIPDLCFYEVIYNLKKKETVDEETIEILDNILSLENLIIYKLDAKEYKTVLTTSIKNNTSTYDGTYLYLHELFAGQKMITLDKRFYNILKEDENVIYIWE